MANSFSDSHRSNVANHKLNKLLLVMAALTAAVIASACARNRGGESEATAPAPVATAPTPPLPPARDAGVSANVNTNAPASQGPGAPPPPAPQPAPQQVDTASAGAVHCAASETTSVTGRPVMDPSHMTAQEVFCASLAQGPVKVGVKSASRSDDGEELYFSPAGQDKLNETIRANLAKTKDEKQKARDLEMARRVGWGLFAIDEKNQRIQISFTIVSAGVATRKTFLTTLKKGREFATGDLMSADGLAVEGECLDQGTTCETVYLRIKEAVKPTAASSAPAAAPAQSVVVPKESSVAHLIIRDTEAWPGVEAVTGLGVSQNPDYDRWFNFFKIAHERPGAIGALTNLGFTTSETVNGHASFSFRFVVRVERNARQLLTINGELLKPLNGESLNQPVAIVSATEINAKGESVQVESPIRNSVKEIRLRRNDGRGNLQLEVVVKAPANLPEAKQDSLLVTFARLHKPTRELSIPAAN